MRLLSAIFTRCAYDKRDKKEYSNPEPIEWDSMQPTRGTRSVSLLETFSKNPSYQLIMRRTQCIIEIPDKFDTIVHNQTTFLDEVSSPVASPCSRVLLSV